MAGYENEWSNIRYDSESYSQKKYKFLDLARIISHLKKSTQTSLFIKLLSIYCLTIQF
jgi:hypothetical protein